MNENGTVNKVILAGEISRSPQRYEGSGPSTYLCFSMITKERFFQNGQELEHVEEHTIRLAPNKLTGQLLPGQWIHIEGKIKTFSFVDEQAIRRYKTEILVVRIQPIGPERTYAKHGLRGFENELGQ